MLCRVVYWATIACCLSSSVSRGQGDARGVLQDAVRAIRGIRSVSYNATFLGIGSREGKVISAEGRVVLKRLPDDAALGGKVWCDATVQKPMRPEVARERVVYDGESLWLRELGRGRDIFRAKYADGGERYTGFSSRLWSNAGFLDSDPLAKELAANGIEMVGRRDVGRELCDVVLFRFDNERSDARWYFSVEDHLPRRIERLTKANQEPGASVLTIEGLRVNVEVSDSLFAIGEADPFQPPAAETTNTKPSRREELLKLVRGGNLLKPGTPAPDWTLLDADGHEHSLRDYRGSVVVLDFWATWCSPCLEAMPHFQKLHEQFAGEKVVVIGVSPAEGGRAPQRYFRKHGYTYTHLIQGQQLFQSYHANPIPAVYVIDAEGVIIDSHTSAPANETETLAALIKKQLAQ